MTRHARTSRVNKTIGTPKSPAVAAPGRLSERTYYEPSSPGHLVFLGSITTGPWETSWHHPHLAAFPACRIRLCQLPYHCLGLTTKGHTKVLFPVMPPTRPISETAGTELAARTLCPPQDRPSDKDPLWQSGPNGRTRCCVCKVKCMLKDEIQDTTLSRMPAFPHQIVETPLMAPFVAEQ